MISEKQLCNLDKCLFLALRSEYSIYEDLYNIARKIGVRDITRRHHTFGIDVAKFIAFNFDNTFRGGAYITRTLTLNRLLTTLSSP